MLFGYERLDKIKIRHCFKVHKPDANKIVQKAFYYLANKKFDSPIVIYDGKLVDGYINYLLAKEIGKKFIKVIKIENECKNCLKNCKGACKKKYCGRFEYDRF